MTSPFSMRSPNQLFSLACCIIVCLATCFFAHPASLASEAPSPKKAEYFFRELPTSIFDNTAYPLSEEEKEYLLEIGYCSTWMVKSKEPDLMVLTAMSVEEAEVQIKIYRAEAGGGLVALSARSDNDCATELWSFNPKGGLVPFDSLEDPEAGDFFVNGGLLPPIIGFSYSLCLRDAYLEAKPNFWNANGPLEIAPDNDVLYVWNNGALTKKVIRATNLESLGKK